MKLPPEDAGVRYFRRPCDLYKERNTVERLINQLKAWRGVATRYDKTLSAAVDLSVSPHEFFTASARALTTGLVKAGVRQLAVVGLASIMPGASGAPLMDEPGYPNEYRAFYLGHAAGLAVLQECDLDWAYVAPAGDFDHAGTRTGRYRIADHADPASRITYADFAVALLDEIEVPHHRRAAVSIREV